jgi:2-hydroxychromene-2-carboxylate isomerase
LNHYLRWKEEESIDTFDQVPKDDIIPTDEQLVAASASQLIWHDAFARGVNLEDPAVRLRTAEIAGLSVSMVHPRVRLSKQLVV